MVKDTMHTKLLLLTLQDADTNQTFVFASTSDLDRPHKNLSSQQVLVAACTRPPTESPEQTLAECPTYAQTRAPHLAQHPP